MKFVYSLLAVASLCYTGTAGAKTPATPQTLIVGYIETISIPQLELSYSAKLDTGATTSSIHGEIIDISNPKAADNPSDEPEQDLGSIVFSLNGKQDVTKHVKKPISRWVRIKTKRGDTIRRPVVNMRFCIAGRLIEEEVNISKRSHYNYDVLIGRNMLKEGNLLVDSNQTFTAKANCATPSEKMP